jgi:hypothetical protein
VVAMAVAEMAGRVTKPKAWDWAMLSILLSVFAIPGAYLPRYSLVWLCLLAMLAARAYTRVATVLPGILAVLLLATGLGLAKQARQMASVLHWTSSMSAPRSLLKDRGRSMPEKVDIDRRLMPSAQMLKTIRQQVGTGQTLYYAVKVYATTMWNLRFDNLIHYIPVINRVDQIAVNVPPDNAAQWLGVIEKDKPDWLLVYARSGVAELLEAHSMSAHYRVFFRDEPSGKPEQDQWNAVLLQRID